MKIQLAYTPDADDAYMLYGLECGAVAGEDLTIETTTANLPSLNNRASRGAYDVTMVSAAAYAYVRDRYRLLPTGATFGLNGVGPAIVSRDPMSTNRLAESTVAIPGATTTAYVMLQMACPSVRTRILPFDKLLPAVETGLVDCALVIHEEFVTYRQFGLQVVFDLGQWWLDAIGDLPMPVTCCVVRKDLPAELQRRVSQLLQKSIQYARSHHAEALDHAMQYSHGTDRSEISQFTKEYVNDLSVEMGPSGRKALEVFFDRTARADILPPALPLDLVEA